MDRELTIREGKSDITKETLRLGKEYETSVYHKQLNFLIQMFILKEQQTKSSKQICQSISYATFFFIFKPIKSRRLYLSVIYPITHSFVAQTFWSL